MKKEIFAYSEPAAAVPVTFDSDICNGCNICVEVCQTDLFIPNSVKGKPPVILYPGECWHGGCCVAMCPEPGAIILNRLPMNSVHWKRKDTGEDFWL